MRTLRAGVAGAMVTFTALAIAGFFMLWWLPQTVCGAAVLLGVATGGLFPIALLLPLEFSSSRSEATRLSGLTQSGRSEEHTSELQSLMRTSYAVFCLKKK